MAKLFICHRREAVRAAEALERELRERFGQEQVLRDGEPSDRRLSARLVLIDEGWTELCKSLGEGVADGGVILPVLIEDAAPADQLRAPATIRALPLRQRHWQGDVERIGEALERAGLRPSGAGRSAPFKLIAGYALGLVAALGVLGERQVSGGVALLGAAALGLGALAYLDHRHRRFPHFWPSLGALVVSGLPLVFALGGAVSSPPAALPTPAAAVRVMDTHDGGAVDEEGPRAGRRADRTLSIAGKPAPRNR
jgi:hypothetical protein